MIVDELQLEKVRHPASRLALSSIGECSGLAADVVIGCGGDNGHLQCTRAECEGCKIGLLSDIIPQHF